MIKTLLIIGTGGFLGSISRFLASRYIQNIFPSAFPFGTFLVNITGCFLIGLIYGISERSSLLTSGWKMFLCNWILWWNSQPFQPSQMRILHYSEMATFSILCYIPDLAFSLGIGATFLGVIITKIL